MSSTDPTPPAPVHFIQGLEPLDEHQCYRLLGQTRLGRVAVSIGALPAVFPVHYALLGRNPVFRTGAVTKLAAASSGNVLCLEIDHADPEDHTGWSVMVTGGARVLSDPEEIADALALPLRPWVGGGDAFVVIEPGIVSGRRIAPRHATPVEPTLRT